MTFPTSSDPIVVALWDDLRRQADLSDANPPPPRFAPFPTGWHTVPGSHGTAINLLELADAVRKVLP